MGKKILIADDALFMRNMIMRILREEGYTEFLEAANGQEACDIYGREHPDLVFMDITMPEMSGLTALQNIKSKFQDAVIVMCSAIGQEGMIEEALINGAKDFIVKPFKREQITSVAKYYLEGK